MKAIAWWAAFLAANLLAAKGHSGAEEALGFAGSALMLLLWVFWPRRRRRS